MRRQSFRNLLLIAGSSVLLLTIFAAGIRYATQAFTLGHDYITFWHASRFTLLEAGNPYSPELTFRSQMAILGRQALPGEDQAAFSYPPFSLIAVLPFMIMPFEWSQAFWMSFNLLAWLSVGVFLKLKPIQTASIIFFFPLTFGILLGNFAPIVGVAVLFSAWLAFFRPKPISLHVDIAAAGLMAWATIKPQLAWMFILLFIVCACTQKRWRLLIAFSGWMAMFFIISFIWVPTWLQDWLSRIGEYQGYVTIGITITTLLQTFMQQQAALLITIACAVGFLVIGAWLYNRWSTLRDTPLLLFAWAGLGTFLFHPHGLAYEQVAFLIPFFIWAAADNQNLKSSTLFWFVTIAYSWTAYFISFIYPVIDYTPVLINLAWLIWLFKQKRSSALPEVGNV